MDNIGARCSFQLVVNQSTQLHTRPCTHTHAQRRSKESTVTCGTYEGGWVLVVRTKPAIARSASVLIIALTILLEHPTSVSFALTLFSGRCIASMEAKQLSALRTVSLRRSPRWRSHDGSLLPSSPRRSNLRLQRAPSAGRTISPAPGCDTSACCEA